MFILRAVGYAKKITSTLLNSPFIYSDDLLSLCVASSIIWSFSLIESGRWRSCKSVPGRIPVPVQTPVSPSCWHLQVRRQTQCSEYQTGGWAGGWSGPDAYTHTQINIDSLIRLKSNTNQSHILLVLVSWMWCKNRATDAMLHFLTITAVNSSFTHKFDIFSPATKKNLSGFKFKMEAQWQFWLFLVFTFKNKGGNIIYLFCCKQIPWNAKTNNELTLPTSSQSLICQSSVQWTFIHVQTVQLGDLFLHCDEPGHCHLLWGDLTYTVLLL